MPNYQRLLKTVLMLVVAVLLIGAGLYAYYQKSAIPAQSSYLVENAQKLNIFEQAALRHIQAQDSSELIALRSLECSPAISQNRTEQAQKWVDAEIKLYIPNIQAYKEGMLRSRAMSERLRADILSSETLMKDKQPAYTYLFSAAESLNIGEGRLVDNENKTKEIERMLPCIDNEIFYTLIQKIIPSYIPTQLTGRDFFSIREIESAAFSLAEAKKYFFGEKSLETDLKAQRAQNLKNMQNYDASSYVQQLRVIAEIYYDKNGSYVGLCDKDEKVLASLDKIICQANSGGYAITSKLPTGGLWCIDGTGFSGEAKSVNSQLACTK